MELRHGNIFLVDETQKAATSEYFNTYVCDIDDRQNAGLLQISTSACNNERLTKAVTALQLLKLESEKWDEKYHFDWLFPEIVSAFLYQEAGVCDRQVVVLSFRRINNVRKMSAIAQIINSGRCVDIRTAIWIFGRMLKLLMFIHPRGYSIGITPSKMLIHPGTEEIFHQAVMFDWTSVVVHGDTTPIPFRQEDIKTAAKTILELLGANCHTGEYPYEDANGFVKYVFELTKNDGDTHSIYESYYRYVYDKFGREFHPFTTMN